MVPVGNHSRALYYVESEGIRRFFFENREIIASGIRDKIMTTTLVVLLCTAANVIGFGWFGTECEGCGEINAPFVLIECEDCDAACCQECVEDCFYDCNGCGGYICCECVRWWRGDSYCDDCYVFPHDHC